LTTLHDVIDQMRSALPDEPPHALEVDGKRRYFGAKKKCWYRLREMRTRGGTLVVVGAFGDFRHGGVSWKVDVDWKGISADERAHLQQQREAAHQHEQAERARLAALAKMTAGELWRNASQHGQSKYLQRKLVEGESCRYLPDGSIVLPLLRYDLSRELALQAVQRIWPDGTKRFTKGFTKPRCSVRLGHVVVGEPILVCEGYATGLSIRMAIGRRLPVFVALDAYNLRPVCEVLRELYPEQRLLICADDDWRTQGNPGRDEARKTAKMLGALCDTVHPSFAGVERGTKDTDFNDLHARAGLGRVQRQLTAVLDALRRYRRAA